MGAPWGLRTLAKLRWTRAERGCAPVAMALVTHLLYLMAALLVLRRSDRHELIDVAYFSGQVPVLVGVVLVGIALLALGLWLRRIQPDALWYQYVGVHYFSLSLVWMSYLTGTLGFATGAVQIGGTLTAYIILERRVILSAFLASFILVLGLNLASAYGWLPYAPALARPHSNETALFWTNTSFFLAAPQMITSIVATMLMIGQWRQRESQVLQLSLTDALTQVHNRRSILSLLRQEVFRSRRRGTPLSVALVDLDYFKQINDLWGHPTGDRVLQAAAAALTRTLREGDAVGRFGGEEFLILLPDTTEAQATQVLERCRKQLMQLNVHAAPGTPLVTSASFGLVCNAANQGTEPEALVTIADEALYAAKDAGRNRVKSRPLPHDAAQPIPSYRPVGRRPRQRPWLQQLRLLLEGAPRWSPVALSALMMGIAAGQFALYGLWALAILLRDDAAQLINVAFVKELMPFVGAAVGGAVALTLIGRRLARARRESELYLHVVQQYYGLTLIAFGYLIGALSLPAGILLVGSPLIGFIFFPRRLVLWSIASSVLAIGALAYASAAGLIPYAPLLPPAKGTWQSVDPFRVYNYYLFILPTLITIITLADRTLGHWRQRGAEIRAMSLTDALTRVHNRRSIVGILEKELARSARENSSVALVLLDMDHFKKVNDTWGHPAGDRVLRKAAAVLAETVRESDAVGRFGGEEFLLVLPDTDLEGAVSLAERCRMRLMKIAVAGVASGDYQVSASLGLTTNEASTTLTAEELIKTADEALYLAKQRGRNRVEVILPQLSLYATT